MARILIIEDEVDVADLYQFVLEDEGYQVCGIYADPRGALESGGERGEPCVPDLIILDERLGDCSGTAFLPSLKSAWPEAKILVATADPDAAEAADSMGAHMSRQKPFSLDQLRAWVRDLLSE
jgi:DNA-binding NtrC family response regulator